VVRTSLGQTRFRFGVFEVELRAGELRQHGIKIKLQEQPFQTLALLLERSGDVVTRDELRSRLWSADTFVDFDRGLNKAINRLRERSMMQRRAHDSSKPFPSAAIVFLPPSNC